MTREEYIAKMNEDLDWAPGWDAVEEEFDRIYKGKKPAHYGTDVQSRAMFGGDDYLDGFSIYETGRGYYHIVTFGMSSLYADEESFEGEYSGWGYEMTIKLKEESEEECLWALEMLGNLARYTYKSENYFTSGDCIPGDGSPLHTDTDSKITALLAVKDTSANDIDTVHGKVEFIQMVGITESELKAVKKDFNNIGVLLALMKKDNPELVTDMKRTKSYL
ncbi:MAG: suppressor of fused domain protein [Oscillospiraceae bacterium]|nr:suppressor of fused domain protein [Oscillospiraceae bacterium]